MATRELVLGRERIQSKVIELGQRITADYSGKNLVMIGVLNGAFIFLADLVRAVTTAHEIDFIKVASYGDSASSSGTIHLVKDIEIDVVGKDILLVEDIVDSGRTLAWLTENFAHKQTASVRVCALIDKQERRETEVEIDYMGFVLERGFLVGYGLDYAQQYRHLPEIFALIF